MSKNIIDIRTYTPTENDKLFFDTNIWMQLFCPIGKYNDKIVNIYNNFFLRAISSKAKLFTSSMIISEFFNSYSKIEFSEKATNFPEKYKNYKADFRNTEEFTELSSNIIELIQKKILKFSSKIDDNFQDINLDEVFGNKENFDFNDSYFLKLCEKNDFSIVTNDKDFLDYSTNVNIITTWKK